MLLVPTVMWEPEYNSCLVTVSSHFSPQVVEIPRNNSGVTVSPLKLKSDGLLS